MRQHEHFQFQQVRLYTALYNKFCCLLFLCWPPLVVCVCVQCRHGPGPKTFTWRPMARYESAASSSSKKEKKKKMETPLKSEVPIPQNPNPNSPSRSPLRLWRPAAQKNIRNQWSKLHSAKDRWFSASSAARSHATSLVNAHLSQRQFLTNFPKNCCF